jgi:hypothetical protein
MKIQNRGLAIVLAVILLVTIVGQTYAHNWKITDFETVSLNFAVKANVRPSALMAVSAQTLPISVTFHGYDGTKAITTVTEFSNGTIPIGLNGTVNRYGILLFSNYLIGWSDNPNYRTEGTGNFFYESAPISDFLTVNESPIPTLYAMYVTPFTLANVTILTGASVNNDVTADEFVSPGSPTKTDDLTVATYSQPDGDYQINTLDAEFKMNPFVAAAIYKDPWVGALDNNSTWGDLGRKKGIVTVVDLHVKIDERVVLPDEFNISFTSYAFRPISVRSAIKEDGTAVLDNEIYPYLGVDQPGDPVGYGVLNRIQPNQPTTSFRAKSYLLDAQGNKVPVYDYVIRTRVRTGYDTYGNKITPATIAQIQADMYLSLSGGSSFSVPNDLAKQIAEDTAEPIKFSGFVDGLIKGTYFGPVNSEIEILDFVLAETIDLEGSKIWNDNNNQAAMRPESILISLMKGGEEIDSKTVTPDAAGNWAWTFEGLTKIENGEPITYTMAETNVPADYVSSEPCEIVSTSETLSCVITNSTKGTLTIVKDAIPNSSEAEFPFTIVPEADGTETFALKDDGGIENKKTFMLASEQEYVISEGDVPEGWALDDIVCELIEGQPVEGALPVVELSWEKDLVARILRITLGSDQTAACTFINKQKDVPLLPVLPETGFPGTSEPDELP